MDHVVVNPFIPEHSNEDYAQNVDGRVHGATEDARKSDTEANYDSAPPLMETFGETNNINADTASPILIRENVSLDDHDQVHVKFGGETTEDETLLVSESNQFVDISETDLAAKDVEKDDSATNSVNSEDEPVMNSVLTRSEQICSTEYLDEVIEDAKNNKKMLVSAMNSVIDLMKVVESKEKVAEQANEDATRGCSDILAKVDEVKHALLRAKEANEMHAGEVNAEKAILATELKELQLRLFNLSDERNKALAILEEMRRALEIRMAAALEEIASAEEKKLERERSAREALLYQESQMEKVVEESKKLKLEALENSKLQEFLMDRGHTIDILQGEIAVKCQDVLLLKEKFDKRIPLSQILYSSQTSSIFASSSSSFISTTTPLEAEAEVETYETPKKSLDYGIFDNGEEKTMNSDNGKEKKVVSELKGVSDDDEWELFDGSC
ncbi:uncharacterized protein LOC143625867 [Bidens hawaiensis]|uniref:uncharacterized protein LOC143625867 n=1 Tax=Bidens hawaiensis TaxID=980011 RepID=UPI004049608E